jgi:hypothetical protein
MGRGGTLWDFREKLKKALHSIWHSISHRDCFSLSMNLSNLTSAHLKQVIVLLDKKEALQAQIADLESQISELLSDVGTGVNVPSRRSASRGTSAEKSAEDAGGVSKRGALKESIITELKNAGESGISIKELAEKLNVKSTNLHAWFGSTGKKLEGLTKIGPARYRMVMV